MELAKGRPFHATLNVFNGILDFIFAVTFGLDIKETSTTAEFNLLSSLPQVTVSDDIDEPVEFPIPPRPQIFDATMVLIHSIEKTLTSPFPQLHHWFLRQLPYFRQALATKEAFFSAEIDKAVSRITNGGGAGRTALENILLREQMAAKKEDRAPRYKSRAIFDEVLLHSTFVLCIIKNSPYTALWFRSCWA